MTQEKYPHKLLIVEDETAMLTALTDSLKAEGFEYIFQARNGEEGLATALQENPDLILLDIIMPKMSGTTMLEKLRQDPKGKTMKVIILTNLMADDSVMSNVATHEPSYYMIKSDHSVEEVIQKIKTTLGIEPLYNAS